MGPHIILFKEERSVWTDVGECEEKNKKKEEKPGTP